MAHAWRESRAPPKPKARPARLSRAAAVAGAIKYLARCEEKNLKAVVLLPDSGSRYMSKIYNDKWMEENGFAEPTFGLGSVSQLRRALGERQLITVPSDTRLLGAIQLMKEHGISQVPVLESGRLIGLIHERALLERALDTQAHSLTVGDLTDSDYCTVDDKTDVSVLTDLLRSCRVALVMDGVQLVDVLTRIDIIDHIANISPNNAK